MLDKSGNIIIIDFGLSKKQCYISSCGSLDYACPQMIKRSKDGKYGIVYGFKTDIWSLGIVLFILLFRFHPFKLDRNKDLLIPDDGNLEKYFTNLIL